jgi:purine-nucleoside phosphorylase
MSELKQQIELAVQAIRKETDFAPRIGIILGTGLGGVAREIQAEKTIEYARIPGFPRPTMEDHAGILHFGRLEGQPIVAMQGRFHLYEGYSPAQITFPVRVLKALGIDTLVVSNAAGGINRKFQAGDLMILDDHINFMGVNPLVGANDDTLGPRFPDMSEPYDKKLVALGMDIALAQGFRCHRGTYIAVTGPCLETAAEYRMFGVMQADAVGMSTVPEVIVAKHAGLRVFGVSVITDMCIPETLKPADISEIIAIANEAEPRLTQLILRLISKM